MTTDTEFVKCMYTMWDKSTILIWNVVDYKQEITLNANTQVQWKKIVLKLIICANVVSYFWPLDTTLMENACSHISTFK